MQHPADTTGLSVAGGSVALAGLPWLDTLDLVVRIIAGLLSIAVSFYAVHHYRRMKRLEKENGTTKVP